MTDLRPIAFCNVLYKIIAKVLSSRLKRILPTIISENQSDFLHGRNITDNVLIAFETIHSMKQKKVVPRVVWRLNSILVRHMTGLNGTTCNIGCIRWVSRLNL